MKMAGLFFLFVFFLQIVLFCPVLSSASDESFQSLKEEINALKERIGVLEKKLEKETQKTEHQEEVVAVQQEELKVINREFDNIGDQYLHKESDVYGLDIGGFKVNADITFVGQGTNNANLLGGDKKQKADASYQANVYIEKDFQNVNGKAYCNLRAGEGKGSDRVLVLYSNVENNSVGDEHVFFNEIWYEQMLFEDKLILNLGKLDPTNYTDQNRVAGSDSTQFLGSIFNNNPVIEFPDNSLGIRAGVLPIEFIELQYILLNGTGDWSDISDHLFNIGQITFNPKFFNREGRYRFIAWHNNNDHTEWKGTDTNKGTYGFALSFDQDVTDLITLFTRYGWENPDVYDPEITATGDYVLSLEQSWSAGFQVKGSLWGRKKDVFGFAVGQIFPSDDYKEVLSKKASTEGRIELYYNIYLNDYFALSPDFQYIWNPYGKDVLNNDDPVFVGAIRTHVDF